MKKKMAEEIAEGLHGHYAPRRNADGTREKARPVMTNAKIMKLITKRPKVKRKLPKGWHECPKCHTFMAPKITQCPNCDVWPFNMTEQKQPQPTPPQAANQNKPMRELTELGALYLIAKHTEDQ